MCYTLGVPLRVGLYVPSPRYAVGFPLQSLTQNCIYFIFPYSVFIIRYSEGSIIFANPEITFYAENQARYITRRESAP